MSDWSLRELEVALWALHRAHADESNNERRKSLEGAIDAITIELRSRKRVVA